MERWLYNGTVTYQSTLMSICFLYKVVRICFDDMCKFIRINKYIRLQCNIWRFKSVLPVVTKNFLGADVIIIMTLFCTQFLCFLCSFQIDCQGPFQRGVAVVARPPFALNKNNFFSSFEHDLEINDVGPSKTFICLQI